MFYVLCLSYLRFRRSVSRMRVSCQTKRWRVLRYGTLSLVLRTKPLPKMDRWIVWYGGDACSDSTCNRILSNRHDEWRLRDVLCLLSHSHMNYPTVWTVITSDPNQSSFYVNLKQSLAKVTYRWIKWKL